MVRENLVLLRVFRVERELKGLVLRLLLLRLEHVEELDVLFRVQHAA